MAPSNRFMPSYFTEAQAAYGLPTYSQLNVNQFINFLLFLASNISSLPMKQLLIRSVYIARWQSSYRQTREGYHSLIVTLPFLQYTTIIDYIIITTDRQLKSPQNTPCHSQPSSRISCMTMQMSFAIIQ